jgi:putative ABC transport system permease protein
MKEIVVSKQPRLGFGRILKITTDGIRYRLFRASITVVVIAVAVAFLVNILSESLIKRTIALDTRDRMDQARLVYRWTARLSAPAAEESILRESADPQKGPAALKEFSRLGDLDPDSQRRIMELSPLAVEYLDFFKDLDYAQRRRLVRQARNTAVFDQLALPGSPDSFFPELEKIRSVRLPGSVEQFRTFLKDWPSLKASLLAIRDGQKAVIQGLTDNLDGGSLLEALADAEGGFGETIQRSGFHLPEEEAREVARQVRLLLDSRLVEGSLEHRGTRQLVARKYDVLPGDVTLKMVWRFLGDPARAATFLETMRDSVPGSETLSSKRLEELATYWKEMNLLEQVSLLTADLGTGWMGLGQRMSWLLFVSMLVCAIGISNAMLMTVTERFREIATLKCLGALDSFIMTMFVLESCMMGVVGGLAGGILGLLLGSGRMLSAFGHSFLWSIPLLDLLVSMGFALLVGVLLAALAAVYPSFKAARLAPMEAMRIE